ncbi:MAG: uroporphyrinogen-III C-methyltransferase [Johnsonella sp.]|nr:uroporphyrinogen-III C-methyltransferase [Johnsonella sp.]
MNEKKREEPKKVWIVGAGPGDPELLTCKALRCLKEADTILYDDLLHPSLLNEAKIDAKLIYVGKKSGAHSMSQEEINALLIREAKEGGRVLRLKGGDPYIFGRGAEEAKALREQGIGFEVLSGISSAIAAPASAGIPLTHRELASSCHIIAGHRAEERELDFASLAKLEGTLVFLMGLQNLAYIVKKLREYGMPPEKKICIISSASRPEQKKYLGTLGDIEKAAQKEKILSPAVIVIGDVVGLSRELDLSEEGGEVLEGRHVLLTGSRRMVARFKPLLEERGARISAISLIEAIPIPREEYREALERIGAYAWIVFTSSNGIRAFFGEPGEIFEDIDFRKFSHLKFAVIGEGTAQTLRKYGFHADFIPSVYSVKALAKELLAHVHKGERVLILRAFEGSEEMNRIFDREKIMYSDIKIYKTRIDERRAQELNRVVPLCDYIFLCSRMGAEALFRMAKKRGELEKKLVSIGPYTTAACKKMKLEPLITARKHSAQGMLEDLIQTLKEGREG